MKARLAGALAAALAGSSFPFAACSSFTEADGPSTEAGTEASGDEGGHQEAATADVAVVDDGNGLDASPTATGCADGTQEGYLSAPGVAACEGNWTVGGVTAVTTCARAAGNTGTKADGAGCSAADLCARDWHVCLSASEVAMGRQGAMTLGPCDSTVAHMPGTIFFATGQPGVVGSTTCVGPPSASDDNVYGCGDLTAPASCTPLNSVLSTDNLPMGWYVSGNEAERATVANKTGKGGVLCCAGP